MPRKRSGGRPVSDANTIVKGNRAYVLAVPKACSYALKHGTATVACYDEDDDEIVTTVVCSSRMGRRIGFAPES